jgi:hypothetical protein
MKDILNKLKSRKVKDRLEAASQIIESSDKPDINTLLDCLSKHPGFAEKTGKPPKDCLWYTKKWLRLEWDASFYRQIDADPYEDMCVLPDKYLDEQECTLLSGAKAVADAAFYEDGGQASVDVLLGLLGIEDDAKEMWIKFKSKSYGTYSDYLYTNVLEVPVGNNSVRVLSVLSNGRIVEVPAEEIVNGGNFNDIS